MERVFCGESSVRILGKLFILRPNFAALHAIETYAGMPVSTLFEEWSKTPARTQRFILKQLVGGRISRLHLFFATLVSLPLQHALLHGLGQRSADATLPTLDWPHLFRLYCGMMRVSPPDFWQLTLFEAALIADGFFHDHPEPPDAHELRALMARFPDSTP